MGFFTKNKKVEQRMLQSEMVRMITGYQPVFSAYAGGMYEMGLTVSAIDAFARHISKANPKIKGASYANMSKQWQVRMNDTMTTSQFLYRLATIFKCENNAFIIPIYDQYQFISGFYPVSSIGSSVVNINNELMLRYWINGKEHAIPYAEVGHMKNHHYKNELYGDGNNALQSTLSLLDTQDQGIVNGIKQSAFIRFIARLGSQQRTEDITKMREEFVAANLTMGNNNGVLLYDMKIADIKQVDSKPFVVDAEQASFIQKNVENYLGVNTKIMSNDFTEDTWGSYYEGSLEPFLIQLSQVITSMLFTNREISVDNYVIFESVRLQHANTATKISLITQMFDRGFMSHNEGLEIMNLPPIDTPEANEHYIRLEYVKVGNLGKVQMGEPQKVEVIPNGQ